MSKRDFLNDWADDYYTNWWAPAVIGRAIYEWWQRRKSKKNR